MGLKKGDYVFVKPHDKREDVFCGDRHPDRLGGEFYRFVHYTNKDTAFVSRPVSYCESVERWEKDNKKRLGCGYSDGCDRILVPIDTMTPVFGVKRNKIKHHYNSIQDFAKHFVAWFQGKEC